MTPPRPRGFALALSLLLILILATVSFGAMSLSTLDSRTARQDAEAARAFYAARAGLSLAMARLAWDFDWRAGSGTLGDETYAVQVVPRADNASRLDKAWRVTSVGTCGEARRELQATVELESFARFAYFTDQEFSSANTPIYFATRDELDGAVHTNGYFHVSGHPRFASRMTSSNGGDGLYDGASYTYRKEGTQRNPARFYRPQTNYATDSPSPLDASPSFSFAGGQSRIPLPADPGLIRRSADRSYTGTHELQFRADGSVLVRRRSGSTWTTVETLRSDASPGVTLYVEGEVYVNGTVRGRVTLGASRDVHLNGDLVYADPALDVMGIVGQEDIVVEASSTVRRDRYVHAIMMALDGSFRVESYDSGVARGELHLFGGVIQARRGPVGTLSGTAIRTGYAKDYRYDQKLLHHPPLNFPTTGQLQLRSLLDRGSVGGV